MPHPVRLLTTLFAIVLVSHAHVAMAADHAMRTTTGQQPRQERAGQPMRSALALSSATLASDHAAVGQSTHRPRDLPPAAQVDVEAPPSVRMGLWDRRPPEGPAPFSLFPNIPEGESGEGAEDFLLVQDEHDVSDDENAESRALGLDWGGLGTDTAFFLGYQVMTAGVTYLLPERVTKWTAEQKRSSASRWWENVQQPHWDRDHWYLNYLGHPYFGAISYIRARERRVGAFGAFWYAALLSGLFEFGIEAVFERPSYQDLIVTPVAGALLGVLLFEPIRERILGKPERQWYDHLTLTLTDPLGTANSMFERLLGIEADLRDTVWSPCPGAASDIQRAYRWVSQPAAGTSPPVLWCRHRSHLLEQFAHSCMG
jgi:hypothetical protein